MHGLDFMKSLCEKITPIIEPLSQHIQLNVFGYRRFFPNGTCFNISSSFEWTNFIQEKFSSTAIPNYENEVSLALKEKKHYFLRIGEPDRQDLFLSMLYDCNVWNTLSLYENNGDSVDGFYITSTRENHKVVNEYFNNLELFENFSHYFKDKLNDIITLEDIKKESSPAISPKIFEEYHLKTYPDRKHINIMP